MALTLADHAVQHDNPMTGAVVKIFEEESPVLRYLPMVSIPGDAHRYPIEEQMPGVEWRRVNQDYVESTGQIGQRIEPLYLLGGQVYVDNFLLKTQGGSGKHYDHKRVQWEMKSRAIGREHSRAFFEGDDLVDPDELPGLRRRLTGTQVQTVATNGGPLTLALLDVLIDSVVRGRGMRLFMNKTLRRNLTTLILSGGSGATYNVNFSEIDEFGDQVTRYAGIPVHIIEDRGNANTILGFDEVCGSSSITSSIYCVNMSEETCYGIYAGDGPPVDVHDLGEDHESPGIVGRIEFFNGLVLKHPRAAGRLRGVLAA